MQDNANHNVLIRAHLWASALRRYPAALLLLVTTVYAATLLYIIQTGGSPSSTLAKGTVFLGIATALTLIGIPAYAAKERYRRSGITVVDTMDGVEFEQRLAHMYAFYGYKVRSTAVTGDFGADLVLERPNERKVVQAKRYSSNVGVEAVQQAVAAMAHYGANSAAVVTNSYFTAAAQSLAASNGVQLVDRSLLVQWLSRQMVGAPAPRGVSLLLRQTLGGVMPALSLFVALISGIFAFLLGVFRTGRRFA
jgi:hypothetical protein